MQLLFEEGGEIRAGTVLTQQGESYQVELPAGKRTKVKSRDVLLQFAQPSAIELVRQTAELANQAERDALTGLYNRRYWFNEGQKWFEEHQRQQEKDRGDDKLGQAAGQQLPGQLGQIKGLGLHGGVLQKRLHHKNLKGFVLQSGQQALYAHHHQKSADGGSPLPF